MIAKHPCLCLCLLALIGALACGAPVREEAEPRISLSPPETTVSIPVLRPENMAHDSRTTDRALIQVTPDRLPNILILNGAVFVAESDRNRIVELRGERIVRVLDAPRSIPMELPYRSRLHILGRLRDYNGFLVARVAFVDLCDRCRRWDHPHYDTGVVAPGLELVNTLPPEQRLSGAALSEIGVKHAPAELEYIKPDYGYSRIALEQAYIVRELTLAKGDRTRRIRLDIRIQHIDIQLVDASNGVPLFTQILRPETPLSSDDRLVVDEYGDIYHLYMRHDRETFEHRLVVERRQWRLSDGWRVVPERLKPLPVNASHAWPVYDITCFGHTTACQVGPVFPTYSDSFWEPPMQYSP